MARGAAFAITRWPRDSSGAGWANSQQAVIGGSDRTAAGTNCPDVEDPQEKGQVVYPRFIGVMGNAILDDTNIGASTANVEGDQLGKGGSVPNHAVPAMPPAGPDSTVVRGASRASSSVIAPPPLRIT